MSQEMYWQFKLNGLWLAWYFNKANEKPFNDVRTNCRFMRCQIMQFEIDLNTFGTIRCTRHDKMHTKPRTNKQKLSKSVSKFEIFADIEVATGFEFSWQGALHCIFHIIYICLNNAHVRLRCPAIINTNDFVYRDIKKTWISWKKAKTEYENVVEKSNRIENQFCKSICKKTTKHQQYNNFVKCIYTPRQTFFLSYNVHCKSRRFYARKLTH